MMLQRAHLPMHPSSILYCWFPQLSIHQAGINVQQTCECCNIQEAQVTHTGGLGCIVPTQHTSMLSVPGSSLTRPGWPRRAVLSHSNSG